MRSRSGSCQTTHLDTGAIEGGYARGRLRGNGIFIPRQFTQHHLEPAKAMMLNAVIIQGTARFSNLYLECDMIDFPIQTSVFISVLQIIAIDILLGGDNAVVIALACRKLPPHQRNKGIAWGVVGAIALRIVLIFFALQLLALPFLKVIAAVLLIWIGLNLMEPEDGGEHANVRSSTTLLGAIKTIVVADAVMSLDNVIAVAGAANGDLSLVVFGIVVSIPIIVWGSKLVLRLMDRFPFVITGGAALLGWIAGHMAVSDPIVVSHLKGMPSWFHYLSSGAGALLVVVIGKSLSFRKAGKAARPVDLSSRAVADTTSSIK
jgi:YjbE family integral membrane protein